MSKVLQEEPRMHIYLAGPMRGMPEHNYPAFHQAEDDLLLFYNNVDIFNPAKTFGGDKGKTLREYYKEDFEYILTRADTMAFMEGWQGSQGALIEYSIARDLELDFIMLDEPMGITEVHRASEWPEHAPVAYEAHRLVFGARGASYGHPANNFEDIGSLWSAHLGHEITPLNVADMMTLFKIARDNHAYKRDNIVDAIGYQIAKERVVDGK